MQLVDTVSQYELDTTVSGSRAHAPRHNQVASICGLWQTPASASSYRLLYLQASNSEVFLRRHKYMYLTTSVAVSFRFVTGGWWTGGDLSVLSFLSFVAKTKATHNELPFRGAEVVAATPLGPYVVGAVLLLVVEIGGHAWCSGVCRILFCGNMSC